MTEVMFLVVATLYFEEEIFEEISPKFPFVLVCQA